MVISCFGTHVNSLADIFADDGPLAKRITGYKGRLQQFEMAERIAAAIKGQNILVAEAGTGTGKTFAYLVPAMLSGGKVIVSTGTKTLQDQLFSKDVPTVRDALGAPIQVALLKGRANYLCHYHLELASREGRFASKEDAAYLPKLRRFLQTTRTGDKAECFEVPETATVWQAVTSTRENCLGQDCPNHKECFVLAARKDAVIADLVVVNHHLFFADVMLRDDGMAELLPSCNTVIFDEAHQLPEVATLFFGNAISTAQVIELARDTHREMLTSAADCRDLAEMARLVEKAAKDLRLSLGIETGRFTAEQIFQRETFEPALDDVLAILVKLLAILETQAQRAEGLEKCWQRTAELIERLETWRKPADSSVVLWAESFTHSLQLNATPLEISGLFHRQLSAYPRSWIFTSATLAVQGRFEHYCREMGIPFPEHARASKAVADGVTAKSPIADDEDDSSPTTPLITEAACWESPFDYPSQAMLYVPAGLPEPNSPNYTEAVVKAAFPLVKASNGGAFFLCTSLRAMRRTHELLKEALAEAGLDFPIFLQGEGSKTDLLERFRFVGNGILVGSQSFWEGVDVRGEALSLVVIDKIPFAPPDDPVLSARIAHMTQQGRNAFMEYQLPRAVINVKQGAGRLIRDERDRGVLMIADPRLITKPYGKRVWRSLPPMKRTRVEQEVLDFFVKLRA
jgi:ATP-dependent DNA helicase DinG